MMNKLDEIQIQQVESADKGLHALILKLDCEMREKYPDEGIYGLDFQDPKVRGMFFAVAYANNTPVGCGALRPLDPCGAELKRFYVDSSYRNRGIASMLLAYLEEQAKALGYRSIKLETGPKQPESIGLYKKLDYVEIPLFGEYTNSDYSLCFEKVL